MQIPQHDPAKAEAKAEANDNGPIQTGHHVHARGARWRVVDVRTYDDCRIVTLSGLAPPQLGVERRVITPFDILDSAERIQRPRLVGVTPWRRACRALLASDCPPRSLRAARSARIDLMPHQLEPALAIVRGLGSRVLLADEVGLGKTIQAGLVTSELRARGAIERALILTPAGLREQWVEEWSARFDIDASCVDAPTVRRLASQLPIGVNPWSTLSTAVASLD